MSHRKLPWPMSRIERDCLHELWCEAKRTGKPITAVVEAAVVETLNRKLEQKPGMPATSAA